MLGYALGAVSRILHIPSLLKGKELGDMNVESMRRDRRAIDFGIQSVVCGSAVSVSPRSFSEMQDLRSHPNQLHENLYFNKISR